MKHRAPRVTSYVKEFTQALEVEFQQRTRRAAEVVRQQLRTNLSTPGSGQPSKPGEFPRMQSGKLVRGIVSRLSSRSPYSFRIENRAPYSSFLEYGTTGGRIIQARNRKALAFMGQGGSKGKTIIVKKVIQGSIQARSPIHKTLDQCRPRIRAIYTRGISSMLKGNRLIVRIG